MPQYAFGRRPPVDQPAMRFAALAPALVPAYPPTYDVTLDLDNWLMLGNDRYGDCVAVSWATERRIKTKGATYPSFEQVIEFYKTQNPGFPDEDNGMYIQEALGYLVKHGGPDGVKAVAFAKVDHTNVEEMRAATYLFGCLWLGVNVTDTNQTEFRRSCWSRAGTVEGGHSIILIGYDATRFLMETWAAEACLTTGYVQQGTSQTAGTEEAWVVIWPEDVADLTPEGRTVLADNFRALTGREITWPDTPGPFQPEPEPEPVDPPPDPAEALVGPLSRFVATKACPAYLREAAQEWLPR